MNMNDPWRSLNLDLVSCFRIFMNSMRLLVASKGYTGKRQAWQVFNIFR